MAKAPGPGLGEILRHLPQLLGDRLAFVSEVHRKYGDFVRLPLGPRTVYCAFHPDLIRHVLVVNAKNYWKGRTFEKTSGYLGKGLATAEGAAWQVQRRRMNPQFHRDALKGLGALVSSNISRMLDRWSVSAAKGQTLDLSLEFQRLAMEIVARTLFGADVEESKITAIIDAIRVSLDFTTSRTLNPFDIPESFPLPSNLRYKKAIATLDEIVFKIIDDEKKRTTPSGTLLSMLVRAEDPETGERMSERQLRDEVTTMFLGGTDTSGNTLSWVFYNLSRLPDVLARVREEIDSVLGGRAPEASDLEKLDYTRRTVEETLRLFPQNWVMSRDALGDDVIGGFDVPAGSTVFLGVYVAHRRPDFWENAILFDPDRFLPEKVSGRHPMSYLPFGAGPRKCIGFNFAMMEFLLAIPLILQRFDVTLTDPAKVTRYATWSLWPKPGLFAKLTEKQPRSVGAAESVSPSLSSSHASTDLVD